MAKRFYLVPQVFATPPGAGWPRWRPKYLISIPNLAYSCRDYGHQGYMLVAGDVPTEITAAAHQALVDAPDAFVIPENRNQQIGANLLTVQDALETMGFPADWVTASMTYNRVLRLVWAAIQLFRHVAGRLNTTVPFITGAVTLQTQFQDIPAAGRQALLDTAVFYGIDTTGMGQTTTLREMIREFADQVPPAPFREELF